MHSYIQISKINDFIFCPYSVYLHSVYEIYRQDAYHRTPQKVGKMAHNNIDKQKYSTDKNILQGISIFSEKYGLVGKIDIFNKKTGELIERKYKLHKIYDGYRYQLYAQRYCLEEMGYKVKKMSIHSLVDNKKYDIPIPSKEQTKIFSDLIEQIKNYIPRLEEFRNPVKCNQCIYKTLCH